MSFKFLFWNDGLVGVLLSILVGPILAIHMWFIDRFLASVEC